MRDEPNPPARLGRLLRRARHRRGLTRRAAGRRSGIERTVLAEYERGAAPVPGDDLERLAALYGGAVAGYAAPRERVDVGPDRITAGGCSRTLASAADEEVLGRYLELLAELRRTEPGTPLALRTADLEALAEAVGGEPGDVEERLVALMGCSHEEAARLHAEMLRRRILVPVAGLVLGAAALAGGTALARTDGHTAPTDLHEARRTNVEQPASRRSEPAAPTATSTPSTPTTTAATTPPATTAATPPTTTRPETSASTVDETAAAPAPTPPTTSPPVDAGPPPPAPGDHGPSDPPVSIPPGESFVEIGTPLVVHAPGSGDHTADPPTDGSTTSTGG